MTSHNGIERNLPRISRMENAITSNTDINFSNDNSLQMDTESIIHYFKSKYNIILSERWIKALKDFYTENPQSTTNRINEAKSIDSFNRESDSGDKSYGDRNNGKSFTEGNQYSSPSVSSTSMYILEKEFIYSNFYQSVSPPEKGLEWRCKSMESDAGESVGSLVKITSQNDVEKLDRIVVENLITFQIDEVQDILLPLSEVSLEEEDDEMEQDDEDGKGCNDSLNASSDHSMQIRLFRYHLDALKKKDGTENTNHRRRMLKFSLTDGQYRFYAIEFESLLQMFPNVPLLGTKFSIQNFQMRRGVILLAPKSIVRVWGGLTEELITLDHDKRKKRRI